MYRLSSIIATAVLVTISGITTAADTTHIPSIQQPPLFDGRCEAKEWQQALEIPLQEDTAIFLMHDQQYLYICAKGKARDYTAFDLYAKDAETGEIFNLHASAQLSERKLEGAEWSETKFWNHQLWGGLWVPYAGEQTTDNGNSTVFLEGSHRELQILRSKFSGKRWRLMFRISAVYQADTYGAEFYYPKDAKDKEPAGWAVFSFSN